MHVRVTVLHPLEKKQEPSESVNILRSVGLRGRNPRAGSRGSGLRCPTLGPDLTSFVPGQDRTGPRDGQTGRISGTKKDLRGPLTRDLYGGWWCETRARTPMNTRSHSVKKPGPVLRGTLSHAIRREFPTPHPISEFSSRTDKSASSPGCSSCAKLGDLAAGSSCRERMAPRYREAFVTMSSRRSISVSELQHKDFCRCDALAWEGGCAS